MVTAIHVVEPAI